MRPSASASALLLLLVAPSAWARLPDDRIVLRTLKLSEHPSTATHNIHVSGQVVTVLRFDQEVDPAKTKLLGWEGRFEPLLVGSKKVVIEPLRNLGRDEGVPLLVTLVDGTEIPFLVRPPWDKQDLGWTPFTDHQVNVFKDPDSYNAVLSSLNDALQRESELRDENERLKREEKSIDHAYATLLFKGDVKKTPFRRQAVYRPKNDDMAMVVEIFSGPRKAAVLVHLTNTGDAAPWTFDGAYVTRDFTSHTEKPFALRMDRTELAPGQSGKIAVVVDESAFDHEGKLVDLSLLIFRGDGLLQVAVTMDHTLIRQ
ncbi:DUF2381 family protein [Stigmatella aurantiaca]|uniref:DUF2381 family protein n=1 Tax=Stigmatella aurantiaca TaxID=41 RepID=UPI0009458465|nr:DUF2381 family protein [Stigmatella aurantiaca]